MEPIKIPANNIFRKAIREKLGLKICIRENNAEERNNATKRFTPAASKCPRTKPRKAISSVRATSNINIQDNSNSYALKCTAAISTSPIAYNIPNPTA